MLIKKIEHLEYFKVFRVAIKEQLIRNIVLSFNY